MSVVKLSWKKNAKQQKDGLFISFVVSNSNSSHKAMLAACTTEEERQALLAKWEAERLAEEAEIERLRKLAAEQRSVFYQLLLQAWLVFWSVQFNCDCWKSSLSCARNSKCGATFNSPILACDRRRVLIVRSFTHTYRALSRLNWYGLNNRTLLCKSLSNKVYISHLIIR